MRYYSTKTFKLRNDKDDFDHFCSYCGAAAEVRYESINDRDSTEHFSCGACHQGTKCRNLLDQIYTHENEISKLRAQIDGIPANDMIIRSREYENKLRRLNEEYFPLALPIGGV